MFTDYSRLHLLLVFVLKMGTVFPMYKWVGKIFICGWEQPFNTWWNSFKVNCIFQTLTPSFAGNWHWGIILIKTQTTQKLLRNSKWSTTPTPSSVMRTNGRSTTSMDPWGSTCRSSLVTMTPEYTPSCPSAGSRWEDVISETKCVQQVKIQNQVYCHGFRIQWISLEQMSE